MSWNFSKQSLVKGLNLIKMSSVVVSPFCQEKGMILDPKKSLRMELKSSVLGQEQMRPVLSYILFVLGKEDHKEQSTSYI